MNRRNTAAIAAVLVALVALAAAVYFLRPGPSPLPSTAQAPDAGKSATPGAPTSPAPPTAQPDAGQTATGEKPADAESADKHADGSEDAAEKEADDQEAGDARKAGEDDVAAGTPDSAEDAGGADRKTATGESGPSSGEPSESPSAASGEDADAASPSDQTATEGAATTDEGMAADGSPATGAGEANQSGSPSAAAKDDSAGTTEKEAADTASSEPDTAEQPSFDVARIEPTGEGVLAGRAAPGWKIIVESGGETIAETSADDQGEWTIILDRPLSPGAHTLSLMAMSPDGSEELRSTQTVSADVAPLPTKSASLPQDEAARLSDVTPAATSLSEAAPANSARVSGGTPAATMPSAPATVPPAPRAALPTPSKAKPGSAPPLPQTASVEERRDPPPSSLPEQTEPGSYTILPGDTLWDIAERYLGAGWRYKTIFRENRKIIRNPNLIYPEQKMTIAEPPDNAN